MIKLYQGDNLDLLKSLPDNHIDLIYSDVLYGTGRDFVEYKDLKPNKSEVLLHYRDRLRQMHRVLKETGSIYLQCDTKINHWLRSLMDEIFGYRNFKNEIVWYSEYRLKQSKVKYTEFGERILFYTKSDDYYYNPPQIKHKTTEDHRNRCKEVPSVKSGKFKTPFGKSKNCGDIWADIKPLTYKSKENLGYPTQKPIKLIERIVEASSKENDIVADFYMGSGVTADVCVSLNRDFIGSDLSEKAVSLTKDRLFNKYNTGRIEMIKVNI